jgi:hypothetical protein
VQVVVVVVAVVLHRHREATEAAAPQELSEALMELRGRRILVVAVVVAEPAALLDPEEGLAS